MNARVVQLITFATAIVLLLLPASPAPVAAPACGDVSTACQSHSGTRDGGDGSIRLAQVPATSGSGPKVAIVQPKKPVPRNAFKALDKHCARCHQQGRLTRAKPAKNFGNILKLDEIARDPHLILPGNPDGSRLFSRIVKQEMPYDVYTEFSGGGEPSKEDVQAIYDWIESLDAKTVAACADRTPVDTASVVTQISADLNKRTANRRKGMRYLTLTNLYNACANESELGRMRNGVKLLLNSLSRSPRATPTSSIGTGGSIIAFNLDDLGWSPEDWKTLVAAYPYGTRPKSRTFDSVKSGTNSSLPYLRADWFAAAASNPPLYYKLLDLPEQLADLQNELGVDAGTNIANADVLRAGVMNSTVSRRNRVVERHAVGSGYLWKTHDFNSSDWSKSIRKRPLGPGGEGGFEHDMNAVIFSLPNGMNAYFLADGDGKRIDAAPQGILYDESKPFRPVSVGLACMSCHASGVRNAVDELRAHVESNSELSAATRDEALRLYAAQSELDRRIRDDGKLFQNAASEAGIGLEKGKDGLDDLGYLAGKYNRSIDLRIAAAEYGVTKARYASGIVKGDDEARRIKQRLEQGTVGRRTIEPLFLKHAVLVSNDVPVGQVKAPGNRPAKPPLAAGRKKVASARPKKPVEAKPAKPEKDEKKVAAVAPEETIPADSGGSITLVSNKTSYRNNDLAVFTVNASSDCYLTLINVGSGGKATVIFPNKYQQKNFIEGGKAFQFPGPDAPFQFRLKDQGKEKLIAECAVKRSGERIEHDFTQNEFTQLGDYRDHVGEQAEKEGEKKSAGRTKESLLRTAITFSVK